MAKVVVDKLEDVSEAKRDEYEAGPGGKFYLKIEGLTQDVDHPAVKELREAHARSKKERGDALEEAKKTKEALEALRAEHVTALESVVPKAQMEALRKSYEDQQGVEVGKKQKEIDRLSASLRDVLVTKEAQALALSLASDPKYAPHFMAAIVPRLTVDYDDKGKAITRVLDKAGQQSAMTLELLKEEISQDDSFKPLLKGSPATGGGAVGASGRGGAPQTPGPGDSPQAWAEWARKRRQQTG